MEEAARSRGKKNVEKEWKKKNGERDAEDRGGQGDEREGEREKRKRRRGRGDGGKELEKDGGREREKEREGEKGRNSSEAAPAAWCDSRCNLAPISPCELSCSDARRRHSTSLRAETRGSKNPKE
eukprot:6180650-Pleurochrysis_carterae.AAC.2